MHCNESKKDISIDVTLQSNKPLQKALQMSSSSNQELKPSQSATAKNQNDAAKMTKTLHTYFSTFMGAYLVMVYDHSITEKNILIFPDLVIFAITIDLFHTHLIFFIPYMGIPMTFVTKGTSLLDLGRTVKGN